MRSNVNRPSIPAPQLWPAGRDDLLEFRSPLATDCPAIQPAGAATVSRRRCRDTSRPLSAARQYGHPPCRAGTACSPCRMAAASASAAGRPWRRPSCRSSGRAPARAGSRRRADRPAARRAAPGTAGPTDRPRRAPAPARTGRTSRPASRLQTRGTRDTSAGTRDGADCQS